MPPTGGETHYAVTAFVTGGATPSARLREPHSLAIADNRVYCTYCEGEENGLAVFPFAAASGKLGACRQFLAACFRGYGEPKGVAVDRLRGRLFVSFVTEQHVPLSHSNWPQKRRRLRHSSAGPGEIVAKLLRGAGRRLSLRRSGAGPVRNGIMRFTIGSDGIAPVPDAVFESPDYVRFENIDIHGDRLAIADPLNNTVGIYRLSDDGFGEPLLQLRENLAFPHDVELGPTGAMLLVSNYGIEVHEGEVLWQCFSDERLDRVVVFEDTA